MKYMFLKKDYTYQTTNIYLFPYWLSTFSYKWCVENNIAIQWSFNYLVPSKCYQFPYIVPYTCILAEPWTVLSNHVHRA